MKIKIDLSNDYLLFIERKSEQNKIYPIHLNGNHRYDFNQTNDSVWMFN